MLRVLFIAILTLSLTASAQQTEKYKGEYTRFYKAEDLFEKEKYGAAQEEFKVFMKESGDVNDPLYIKAKYYNALSALYLYHADAEKLLLDFLKEYPESIYQENVYFELGRYYYRKRKYEDAINWFAKINSDNLNEEDKGEYYFKLGYSQFRQDDLKSARNSFYEIIDSETQYQGPALYYYSHIAYTEGSYQTALEGFKQLETNPSFSETVPYYIAQIYYLQGKYDQLIEYAPKIMDSVDAKNSVQMSHLIGDAFYRVGKYDEAVPYLEEYNMKSATTRDEDYQLGYAYFQSNDYVNAIKMFDKVARVEDELAQVALYHIGECYLQMENYLYARNAFDLASTMPYDADIEEDALYNYAVLSYKLDFNPFDEAVEALNLYLTRYPNSKRNQDIYQYLINVYTTMKNYKSAMASIDKIEEKDFKIKNAYQMMAFNYGVELYANAQYDDAITNFGLVKRYPIDPKLNALSLYWIAESHYYKADYNEAIKMYRNFLEEPGSYGLPEHNDAYYNIGYCYFKQDNRESAIQSFRTFTQDENEDNSEKITDAYLRIGDCYFMNKNDDQAIIFYQKAVDTKGGQSDYAKYQMGLSYGYKREYDEKASIMLDIVNNHPNSTFVVPALYEVGEAYRIKPGDHSAKALQYYNQLIIDYPNHPKVIDAVFQIGSIHFMRQEYELAEQQFLRILNEFDNPVKKQEALARLGDIYAATNQLEKYEALLDANGIQMDQVEQDSLYFDNALKRYEDEDYTSAISSFEKYLSKFSAPMRATEAYYYLGTAYKQEENLEECVKNYKQVLARPTSVFTETAAIICSQHEYDAKNYTQAIDYYQQLENTATYPENRLTAAIGMMRCYTFLETFDMAKVYADKVLLDVLALDNVKTEAHYVVGKAEFEAGNFPKAQEEFRIVSEESNGSIGAESQFYVALIYHLQEEYTLSEEEVRSLMSDHAGYPYWVAKALILQAKNSMGLEDYVQAEYTLNSVINGYTVSDDGILEEAYQVWDVLQELKNQNKDLEIDNDNTIEIGGDNEE